MKSILVLCFFVCVVNCSVDYDDQIADENDRRRFLSLFGQNNRPRPISNGIQQVNTILREGAEAKANIIRQGLGTLGNQAQNLTATIAQQAGAAIQHGKQMTFQAISAISTPAANAISMLAIAKINLFTRLTGRDVLTLPPISTSLFGFGTFQTSEGNFSRVSTLQQTGSVRMNITSLNSIRMSIPVRLQEMRVQYHNYTFSTWGMHLAGNVSATVANNSMLVHLRILSIPDCVVNIERVEILTLENIDVQLTGLCSFCSSIASFIVNFLHGMIQSEVQKAIDNELQGLHLGPAFDRLICSRLNAAI